MADENAGADEQAIAADGNESDTGTEDTENDGAGEEDVSGEGQEDQGDQSGQDDTQGEPPRRKSAKDYIIERKEKKIQTLQGKKAEGDGEGQAAQPLTRDDLETALEPLKRSLIQSEDEKELQAALTRYPDAKKMEPTIRKYMANDAYAQVPIEFIVRGLINGNEKAAKKKAADDRANASKLGGHGRRPTDTKAKSAWDLTPEEFQKEVNKLMSGQTS